MHEINRIRFAIQHVSKEKSVVLLPKEDWYVRVPDTGESAILEELPGPLSELEKQGCYLATTASGYANPEPGMDVYRKADPPERDGSTINKDHYSVIEDLRAHDYYLESMRVAGITSTPDLETTLQSYVFIVGPSKPDDHWRKDLPILIQEHLYPTKKD
jgi:hypothetical protein